MVAFLSSEWVQALDEAAAGSEALATLATGMTLVVEQEVSGVPDRGTVTYHVAFEDGRVSVRSGPAPSPTVRFSQDLPTAVAIASGALSAQRSFMTGRLRVGGDLSVLLAHGEALAELDDAFADVRRRTELPAVDLAPAGGPDA